MMIYARVKKSKRKLAPKASREQYEQWLNSVNKTTTNFSRGVKPKIAVEPFTFEKPQHVRKNDFIPSLNPTDMSPATKPAAKIYTGDKMLGIATLHKSNAVPVFNNTEAVEISSMRR